MAKGLYYFANLIAKDVVLFIRFLIFKQSKVLRAKFAFTKIFLTKN